MIRYNFIRVPFIASLFFVSTLAAFSQTEQGKVVISGNTNVQFLFSHADPDLDDVVDNWKKTENVSLQAGVGYFIIDNLAIKLSGTYEYVYSKKKIFLDPVYAESIQTSLTILPSVTYFFPVTGKLRPSLDGGIGYVDIEEKNNGASGNEYQKHHYGGLSLNGGAGISYFFNRSFSADLGLRYTHHKLNDKAGKNLSQVQNNFGVHGGLAVYF